MVKKMDRKLLQAKIDLDKIEEREITNIGVTYKGHYIIDEKGTAIMPISMIEMKIIERIKQIELQLKEVRKQ